MSMLNIELYKLHSCHVLKYKIRNYTESFNKSFVMDLVGIDGSFA